MELTNKSLIFFFLLCLGVGCESKSSDDESSNYGKPIQNDEFVELLSASSSYLIETQTELTRSYNLDSYESWMYNAETETIDFTKNNNVDVRFKFQEIGSLSLKDSTWLWAWANPNQTQGVSSASSDIREYGEKHNHDILTQGLWKGTEQDGWEMAAIGAYLNNAIGAYRLPGEDIYSYIIFTEVDQVE